MKRTAAILLLVILVFHWSGYRFLAAYLESRASVQLQQLLDHNEYQQGQLLSLKTPVSRLAYYTASSEFERVDGQIDINGVTYQYVQRRLIHDSLELLCIPNQAATRIQTSAMAFFQLVNDLAGADQQKESGANKKAAKHFFPDQYISIDRSADHIFLHNHPWQWDDSPSALLSGDDDATEHPPDQRT